MAVSLVMPARPLRISIASGLVVVAPRVFPGSTEVTPLNDAKMLTVSDPAASDVFGRSVALSAHTAIVGVDSEDAGGIDAGAAYDFDLLLPKPAPSFTPTATITPTPTVPPPVGGISLDSHLRALPLETASPDSSPWGVVVGTVAAACLVAVGGVAWYARRHVGGEGARWW